MNRVVWSALTLAVLTVPASAEEADAEKVAAKPAPAKPAAATPAKAAPAAPAKPAAKPLTASGKLAAPPKPAPAKVQPAPPEVKMPAPPTGPASPVYCGSFTPIHFRVSAAGKSADQRALHAMDVINKFLGGSVGKFTTRPDGKNMRLMLNNELLAVITPEDAGIERARTAAELASRWARVLTVAFDASKAQK